MTRLDIARSHPRFRDTWRAVALVLWIASMAVITTLIIVRPEHRSVTPVYHHAVDTWWAREPVYEGPQGMNYLPHFMAMFTAYHLGGNRVGDILWRYTAGAALAAGLWFFSRVIPQRQPDRWRAFALATVLVLPLSLPALRNGQANAHLGAALLLAAWCLHTERWGAAAVCLWVAVGIKPLGFAAMCLAWAAYPQLGWRLALGLPVFLAFPFAFGPPGYVFRQGLGAWENLRQCSAVSEHRFADLNGLLRTLGVPLMGTASLAVRAAGGAALACLCYLGVRRKAKPGRALLWLGAAAAFLMLFNPMTEANSYVILAPALALWALWGFSETRPWVGWLLAGTALTMGMLPNLVRPLLGNRFALAWHPAMTIGFLCILVWQSLRSRPPVGERDEIPEVVRASIAEPDGAHRDPLAPRVRAPDALQRHD